MAGSLDRLYEAVLAAKAADPSVSRTARLLHSGRAKMAKKLAEEAVEVVIHAMNGSREAVVRESADLLYNLVVSWVSAGVEPKGVWKEMGRRERLFGIAEKRLKTSAAAPKSALKSSAPKARRKVAAMAMRRPQKRR